MRDEVEAAGARFLFMTLSTAIQVQPDASVRRAYAEKLGVPDLDYPERRFEAFARAGGVAWLSVAPDLQKEAEATGQCVHGFPGPWACQGHWNAVGHRIAGEALARSLCGQLELQATSRSPASIDTASRP